MQIKETYTTNANYCSRIELISKDCGRIKDIDRLKLVGVGEMENYW